MPTYDDVSWLEEHSEAWVVLNYRLDALRRQFGVQPDWRHYYRNLYNERTLPLSHRANLGKDAPSFAHEVEKFEVYASGDDISTPRSVQCPSIARHILVIGIDVPFQSEK